MPIRARLGCREGVGSLASFGKTLRKADQSTPTHPVTPSPLTLGTDAHCLGPPPSPAEGQHCAPGTETIFKPRVKPTGVAAGWSGLSLVPTRVDTFDSCRVTRFITGHYGGRSVRPVREPVSCRVKRTQSGGQRRAAPRHGQRRRPETRPSREADGRCSRTCFSTCRLSISSVTQESRFCQL